MCRLRNVCFFAAMTYKIVKRGYSTANEWKREENRKATRNISWSSIMHSQTFLCGLSMPRCEDRFQGTYAGPESAVLASGRLCVGATGVQVCYQAVIGLVTGACISM